MRNLLSVVPVETTPQRSCDRHDGNRSEEPLQTLHGLFSSGCLLLLFVIPFDVAALMREVDSNRPFGANFIEKCCQNHTDRSDLGNFFILFNHICPDLAYVGLGAGDGIAGLHTSGIGGGHVNRRNWAMDTPWHE